MHFVFESHQKELCTDKDQFMLKHLVCPSSNSSLLAYILFHIKFIVKITKLNHSMDFDQVLEKKKGQTVVGR